MSICEKAKGYSGADMTNLCKVICYFFFKPVPEPSQEAAMYPIRDVPDITNLREEDLRPIAMRDFDKAFGSIRASVSPDEVFQYEEWNSKFGSCQS